MPKIDSTLFLGACGSFDMHGVNELPLRQGFRCKKKILVRRTCGEARMGCIFFVNETQAE